MKNRRLSLQNEFDPKTFSDNETAANKTISVAAAFLSVFLFIAWILFFTKVLSTTSRLIIYTFPLNTVLCAMPICFFKTKLVEKQWFKYFLLGIFATVIGLAYMVVPAHGFIGFALLLILVCHYYSIRLTHITFIVSLILMLICIYGGAFYGDWDGNLIGISRVGAPEFLGIAQEEFVDNVKTRLDVIHKLYTEIRTTRNWQFDVFKYYYLLRVGVITIIYVIALQLSGRTFNLLSKTSKDAREKQSVEGELALAKGIQLNFIPDDFPNTDEFEIYGLLYSAKEVGGDYYDFFTDDLGHVVFDIGDVSGKGIPGALTMMRAKTLMKSFASANIPMKDVLSRTNKELCIKNSKNIFVTSIVGKLDLDSGDLTLSNAAHNPPIIKKGNKHEYLKLPVGFILGGFEETNYKEKHFFLLPGDEIIFYTDGVTEAMNEKDEEYGEERLLNFLNSHANLGLKEKIDALKSDIEAFRGKAHQSDDATMLAIKYKCKKVLTKEITVDTLPNSIDILSAFLNEFVIRYSTNEKAINQLNVAIDEIFSNIVKFAYHPEIGKAILRIELRENPVSITITFIDNGKPFNPLEIATPDIESTLHEREIGGLGIFIVKNTMDEVNYEYKDKQNILTIKKKL